MVKLTPLTIGTVQVLVKVLAFLGSIILRNMLFLEKFMSPMSEGAFGAELALAVELPIPTHLCFEFLLEVALGCNHGPWLHGLDFVSSCVIVVYLAVVEAVRIYARCCHFVRIHHGVLTPGTVLLTCVGRPDISLPVGQVSRVHIGADRRAFSVN